MQEQAAQNLSKTEQLIDRQFDKIRELEAAGRFLEAERFRELLGVITETRDALRLRLTVSSQLRVTELRNGGLPDHPDISSLLKQILEKGLQLTGTDLGNVQLMDWKSGYLTIAAQRGFADPFLEFFRVVKSDDGSACGRAVRHRRPVVIEDVLKDAEFAPCREIAVEAGFRAVQSTPLISRDGAFLGVLSTHFPRRHRPSECELQMLQALGEMAGNAIVTHRHKLRREDRNRGSVTLAALDRSLQLLQCVDKKVVRTT